jgi:hypothetical protein
MIAFDYRCGRCSAWQERFFFTRNEVALTLPCCCGGVAVKAWFKAPGLAGVSEPGTRGVTRTFQPGYDVQSGKFFGDRAERDDYLKGRGLIALGPEEYKRTAAQTPSQPETLELPGIQDAMNEAYEEAKSSREVARLPKLNQAEAMIADEGDQ